MIDTIQHILRERLNNPDIIVKMTLAGAEKWIEITNGNQKTGLTKMAISVILNGKSRTPTQIAAKAFEISAKEFGWKK